MKLIALSLLLTPLGLTLAVAQTTTPTDLLETVLVALMAALGATVAAMGVSLWALVSVGLGLLVQRCLA